MNDQQIIASVRAGKKEAYGELVDRYYKGLHNHLYQMLKDSDEAEDMAQEAFIKAFRSLKGYDSKYAFSTWLYRIATNEALKHLRRKRHVSLDSIPELPDNYDPGAALRLEAREEEVRLAISRIPLKYQTVISLHYWNSMKYEEIAVVMEVPVGTIKTWLHRAKTTVKEELEKDL